MSMDQNLKFISLKYRQYLPSNVSNLFVIRADSWNDFGNHIRFDLHWVDSEGIYKNLGKLKILQLNSESDSVAVNVRSDPPKSFHDDIGNNFISLGQSQQYYSGIYEIFGNNTRAILIALRDIAIMPGLARSFETSTVFRNGLVRENNAKRARRFGSAWSRGENPKEQNSFDYICRLSDGGEAFQTSFDFRPEDVLPGRVVGIIGRNAVGKTRFLAQLSVDLAQVRRVSAESISQKSERFPNNEPLFTKIIAVSYSAFDQFSRPPAHDESSYIYCGIRDERGRLSHSGLQRTFLANKARVYALGRGHEWVSYISNIVDDFASFNEQFLHAEISQNESESAFLSQLSSGQAIMCHFVTGLLGWLQSESLVLFDEPETHLHPNAVANLFLILTEILRNHNSYAIMATHSPIVIQEIPSNRVVVFARQEGLTYAMPLPLESFGESISELTEHVFKTKETDSLYRSTLESLSEQMTFEEALNVFSNKLSMNAKAYLLGRYARSKGK